MHFYELLWLMHPNKQGWQTDQPTNTTETGNKPTNQQTDKLNNDQNNESINKPMIQPLNWMDIMETKFGLESFASGKDPVVTFCEHGNQLQDFIKAENFFPSWEIITLFPNKFLIFLTV
jgi:flavodoxin